MSKETHDKHTENRLNDLTKYDVVKKKLEDRGVTLEEIAELTCELQKQYVPDITIDICQYHVERVVMKREVQHAVLTGIELDILAEEGKLTEPLASMLNNDYGLYGIDEILALSIVNVYGSIGFTNFGYVDKLKPGIIGRLDEEGKAKGRCNTFLDDIVGAIAAAAASSIAHKYSV